MPHNALAAAQQLFSDLRDLDALGVPLIWVEAPPESADWEGVRDRLERRCRRLRRGCSRLQPRLASVGLEREHVLNPQSARCGQ